MWTDRDSYATVMTVEQWFAAVENGTFIPDDGTGYFGTETQYMQHDGAEVWKFTYPCPTTVEAFVKGTGMTHVHWYNK